jgi:hypothetical protein
MNLKRAFKLLLLINTNVEVMDINAERSLIIRELQQVNDISFLRAIKQMIHYALKNEGHISIEQYNKELDEAESRVARGEFYTLDEVKRMAKE